MIKSTFKLALLAGIAVAIATLPLTAAEKPAKTDGQTNKAASEPGAKAARSLPFNGKLSAKDDASITVGSRIFEITPETKFTKDGKPATLTDGVVGEKIGGSYLKVDDKLVAKSVRFGEKPQTEKKPKKEKTTE